MKKTIAFMIPFLLGICFQASLTFFVSVFGNMPFALLPFFSALLLNLALTQHFGSYFMVERLTKTTFRILLHFALCVFPLILILSVVNVKPESFSFISTKLSIENFVCLSIISSILLLPFTIAIQEFSQRIRETQHEIPPRILIFGFAVGIGALGFTLAEIALLNTDLFILSVILTLLFALIHFLMKEFPLNFSSVPELKNHKPKKTKPIHGAFPNKHLTNTLALVTALLPGAFFLFIYHWQQLFSFTHIATRESVALILPVCIAGIAFGLITASFLLRTKTPFTFLIGGIACLVINLIVIFYLWNNHFYVALFTNYQEGHNDTSLIYMLHGMLFFFPSFLFGIVHSQVRFIHPASETQWKKTNNLTLFIITASLLVLNFSTTSDWISWDGIILILLLTSAGTMHAFRSPLKRNAKLVAILLCLIFAITPLSLHQRIRYSFIDTTRFTILSESGTPSGKISLIQSKNYDDPLFAMMFNESKPITQTSIRVRSLLKRISLLPIAIHSQPTSILQLGVGSVTTLNLLSKLNPVSIDVVEENPSMIVAADSLAEHSADSYRKRKTNFYCERQVSFLSRGNTQYALILSPEPFAKPENKYNQFSQKFFSEALRRLTPNGIFVQWIPLNRLSLPDVLSIIKTVTSVFSETTLWFADTNPEEAMLGIMASNRQMSIDPKNFDSLKTSKMMQAQFREAALSSFPSALTYFAASNANVHSMVSNAQIISASDLRTIRSVSIEDGTAYAKESLQFFLRRRSELANLHLQLPDTTQAFVHSLMRDESEIVRAQFDIAEGRFDSARTSLLRIVDRNPMNEKAKHSLATLLEYEGAVKISRQELEGGRALLEQALRLGRFTSYMSRLLMIASYRLGDKSSANVYINQGLQLDKLNAGLYDNAATLFGLDGKVDDAIKNYNRALGINARDVDIYANFATLLYNHHRFWEAIRILDDAVEKCPVPTRAYYLRALMYNDKGKKNLAIENYQKYLAIALPNDPRLEEVRSTLKQLEKTN